MKERFMHLFGLLAAVLCAAFTLCFPSGAEFGTDELYDSIPGESRGMLDEKGITPEGGAEGVSVTEILDGLIKLVTENIEKPLKMFGGVTAVVLLSSLLAGMSDTSGGSAAKVYPLVTAASAAVMISAYLSEMISVSQTAFTAASDFMITYIPIIAGVAAAGGHTGTAAVFSSVTLVSVQILARIASSVIIPLTSCILGITAASSIDPDLKLDRLGEGIKKAVIWGLGLIMTIFLGILSIQSIITASADNAALKTLKFAVSSTVPIVGGAVSEALSTVSGSIALIRSGIGGFGIAAGACVLAPPAVTAICYKFFLFAAGVISDIFGCDHAGRIIKSGENVMSVIIAVLSCFFVFITFSSAVLLAFCRS